MGIVSSAKSIIVIRGSRISGFQSPLGIVSSAKQKEATIIQPVNKVSIPDGDSFLREDDAGRISCSERMIVSIPDGDSFLREG